MSRPSAAATLTSRLLGFLRDAGIAAILGAGVLSDAYFAALQIPNLFRRLLAEGALNSAFVPMWIRIREESGPDGTRRFGEQALGAMARALGLVAVLCLLGAPLVVHVIAPGFASTGERFPLAVTFVRLSVPYVALSGVVAVAASALNAQGRVARRGVRPRGVQRRAARGRRGAARAAHRGLAFGRSACSRDRWSPRAPRSSSASAMPGCGPRSGRGGSRSPPRRRCGAFSSRRCRACWRAAFRSSS